MHWSLNINLALFYTNIIPTTNYYSFGTNIKVQVTGVINFLLEDHIGKTQSKSENDLDLPRILLLDVIYVEVVHWLIQQDLDCSIEVAHDTWTRSSAYGQF